MSEPDGAEGGAGAGAPDDGRGPTARGPAPNGPPAPLGDGAAPEVDRGGEARAPLAPDAPGRVRAGEDVPVEPLARWLAAALPDLAGLPGSLAVRQFPGGHSNLTYALEWGDRSLVLRRAPFGAAIATAHDMAREHRILSRLSAVYPRAPRALAYCDDPSVIGAPFYVMERVHGVVLRGSAPRPGLDAPLMRALSESLIDGLADLHAVDARAAGLSDLGHAQGYVERQVTGWAKRYAAAKTDAIDDMERVAAWLLDHRPGGPSERTTVGASPSPTASASATATAGATASPTATAPSGAALRSHPRGAPSGALVHNDFKYDNLVLDPACLPRIRAVLDWEMATIGDPLLDLGTTLAYWVEPGDAPALRRLPLGPTTLPGNLGRAALCDRYAERAALPLDPPARVFAYAFGLFKVAVIAQQIYARFARGHTRDPRFAPLIHAVRALALQSRLALDTGRIDGLA